MPALRIIRPVGRNKGDNEKKKERTTACYRDRFRAPPIEFNENNQQWQKLPLAVEGSGL